MVVRLVRHVDGAPADGARGGVERAGPAASRVVVRVEHVPVRDDDLAHEDAVIRHVGDVHRVRRVIERVEIVRDPREVAALEVEDVLRAVAHAVDERVASGEVLPHARLERAVQFPRERGPAAVPLPEPADDRLPVDLHAVHASRREVGVELSVERLQILWARRADAADGDRVPRLRRLHGHHPGRVPRVSHLRIESRRPGFVRVQSAPVPEERVPAVHVLDAEPSNALDDSSETVAALAFFPRRPVRHALAQTDRPAVELELDVRLRVVPYKAMSGWSSKASEAELKGNAGGD